MRLLGARVGQKKGAGLAMAKREDFEELKEQEVLDIVGNSALLPSHNLKQILDMQLTKRNIDPSWSGKTST